MHDLAGADPAVRFSPYCWRVRMALAHKGLDVETIKREYDIEPLDAYYRRMDNARTQAAKHIPS